MSRLMGWIRLLIGPAISATVMVAIGFWYSWRLGVGAVLIFATVTLAWVVLWLKREERHDPRLRTALKVLRLVTYSLLALASPWTFAALFYRGPLINAVLITVVGAVALMVLQFVYWRLGGRQRFELLHPCLGTVALWRKYAERVE